MFFINISSDKIHLTDGTKEEILARNGIEDILGPVLIDRQKTSPFTEIFLINGPGWFTNLRVGTLMLNTLNMFQEKKIQIFEVDKLTLFAHLVKIGLLPEQGIIYLGQKHNVWLARFARSSWKLKVESCPYRIKKLKEPVTFDLQPEPHDFELINKDTIPAGAFLDEVHDEIYRPQGVENMVKFVHKEWKIYAHYKHKKHEITVKDLDLKPVLQVQAKYMIEPVLN